MPFQKGHKINLGRHRSNEFREKISKATMGKKYCLGYKHSLATRKKMSESKKGKMPKFIPSQKGRIFTKEHIKNLSLSHRGKRKPLSEETKRKIGLAHIGNKWGLGHKCSEERKRKMSEERKGSKGSNWKGGVTPLNQSLRNSLDAKIWRESVFKRDKYVCQMCYNHSKYLRSHHIKPFAFYPELRFEVSNGVTLCQECHRSLHRRGWLSRIHLEKLLKKYQDIPNTLENIVEKGFFRDLDGTICCVSRGMRRQAKIILIESNL